MEKKNRLNGFLEKPHLGLLVLSIFAVVILEVINHKGIVGAFRFIIEEPFAFVINLTVLLLAYSLVLLFRRRVFACTVVSLIWIVMGTVNLILLLQRNTQFNASDILIFRYGILITLRYFKPFEIVLICAGIIVAVILLVFLYRKAPKKESKPDYRAGGITVGVLALLLVTLICIGNYTGIVKPRFVDITEGYTKNGFLYAFGCSLFESGVDEPENYSDDSVEGIASKLDDDIADTKDRPNVIFVQLESFIDPDEINGLEFDGDPVPNFNALCRDYPSGHLSVQVVGGGTANTEFEILTGMNLKYFGTIEYPYETLAESRTCESMAYNYKALGYKAHAIHNFSAGFYMRNEVFANLGFDTFTPFEYMSDIVYNDIGWAKDAILERYIFSALESTEERDFIFAISVQGHGSYPTDFDDSVSDIDTTYHSDDISDYSSKIDYYVSQMHEMDDFVGSLVSALSEFKEECVVVFYGDHIPGIGFTDEMMKSGSVNKTEYVIWSNFGLDGKDLDLTSYQLAAHVQEMLGFSSGKITQIHQKFGDEENYQHYLETAEYDVYEGNYILYGGNNPFEAEEIGYGVEEISINETYLVDKTLYVSGVNFNEHSAVYINGSKKITEYISSDLIMVDGVKIEEGDEITVAQMSYQMPWQFLDKCEAVTFSEE